MMMEKLDLIFSLQQPLPRWPKSSLMVLESTTIETGRWEFLTEEYSGQCRDIYGSGWVAKIMTPNGDCLTLPMPPQGCSFSYTIPYKEKTLEVSGMIDHTSPQFLWVKVRAL